MPEQESLWSRQAHTTPPVEPPPTTQPAHAWLSADAYAAASAPQPTAYAASPPLVAPVAPVEVHVSAPSGGRGLAILGVVLGGLALLGVAVPVFVLIAFGFMDDEPGGGGYGAMRGTLAPASGKALTGQALADEITTKLEDRGDEPEGITCPDTAAVARDVTTVCHGTDYGDAMSYVVFFEDDKGAYTLLEI